MKSTPSDSSNFKQRNLEIIPQGAINVYRNKQVNTVLV